MTYQGQALASSGAQDVAGCIKLKARIHGKFARGLSEAELGHDVDIWQSLPEHLRFRTFLHAQHLLGLKMKFSTVAVAADKKPLQPDVQVMDFFDVEEITIRCTTIQPPQLGRAAFAEVDQEDRA